MAKESKTGKIVNIPPEGVALEEIVRQAIIQALIMSNWVQADAAELLSISRRVMHYKVHEIYKLDFEALAKEHAQQTNTTTFGPSPGPSPTDRAVAVQALPGEGAIIT